MTVSIHQPSYFPWLGLLSKIGESDLFVLLDDVQLADRAYQHRNLFLTSGGKEQMLTIPIEKKGYREKSIRELRIAQPDWRRKHYQFLKLNYGKSPFADQIFPLIEPFYQREGDYLIDPLRESMALAMEALEIPAEVRLQSELDYDQSRAKGELMLALVQAAGGDLYLSGSGAKEYMDDGLFAAAGVGLRYQQFTHPRYRQFSSETFVPGMACLDLLFNEGLEKSREIYRSALP